MVTQIDGEDAPTRHDRCDASPMRPAPAAEAMVLGSLRPIREAVAGATSVDARAHRIGRSQDGRVARSQLTVAGVSRRTVYRRISEGGWTAHAGGVIDLGTHDPCWRQEVVTALLAAGAARGTAWVSHLAAARLHGFLDVEEPDTIDLTVPRSGRATSVHARIHRVRALPSGQRCVADGLPATSPARTILDMAVETAVRTLEPVLWDAARRRPEIATELARAVGQTPWHRGRATVQRLLGMLHPQIAEAGSPLEVHGLLALRDRRLPQPVLQYLVRDHHGRILARVDAAWPAARVAVEFDGVAWHATPTARTRDRERQARLAAAGWVVHVVTARELEGARLEAVKDELRRRIASV